MVWSKRKTDVRRGPKGSALIGCVKRCQVKGLCEIGNKGEGTGLGKWEEFWVFSRSLALPTADGV